MEKKEILVVGAGYVGLSIGLLLAKNNKVTIADIDQNKIKLLKNRVSPIRDEYITKYLEDEDISVEFCESSSEMYRDKDFVVISTPTNYDPETNYFDTKSVETVVEQSLKNNPQATIVIKSTVPIGFTKRLSSTKNGGPILFSPEFLRESKALYDNLYPSRIIVGITSEKDSHQAESFGKLLVEGAIKKDINFIIMKATEAEAVKLFSNTYLAMRVSYFNELDSYALQNELDAENIIKGVCLDPRIGNFYNNPSFGYGGYCLPKDTKQLLANYKEIPQELISAIIASNATRKEYITNKIEEEIKKSGHDENQVCTIGVYKLAMKADSDNFRESAIIDVILRLQEKGYPIVVYEPTLKDINALESVLTSVKIVKSFDEFRNQVNFVITNRKDKLISSADIPMFSRDLFSIN